MTLIQMSISATILIAIITLVRAISINKLPKKIFMFLWGIVLFRLLVPISIASIFSIHSIIPQSKASYLSESINELPIFLDTSDMLSGDIGNEVDIQGFHNVTISLWIVLWMVGFLLCSIYFIIAYHRGIKKFKNSLPIETDFIRAWEEKHPLKRILSIRSSDQILSPLSYGILKPVILLPKNLNFDDTNSMNYILTHEYIHICHFDVLTKMLMILALSIHWFNPMVWIMFLLLNRDIELVCDETVIKIMGEKNKKSYAHILIDMEIQKSEFISIYNSFSRNAIEERIGAIMKMKKMTIFSLLLAVLLGLGVTMAFATSEVSDKEKTQFIVSNLSAEEFEQITALKLDGYENMSISDYQNKVWEITDTVEYRNLLDRILNDDALYKQKDRNAIASYLFNILEPLTSERWQEKEFGGYVQTNYKEASDNALLEYSFIMTIKNPQLITVGQYDKTRLSIKDELDVIINDKTLEELQDEVSMNKYISSKIESIKNQYNSDVLKVDLNYSYHPLSGLKADNTIEAPVEEYEEGQYPNATREDYQSLLALKTPNYKTMSVSDFNRNLMEWANENYNRFERIAMDYTREDYKIPLSKEEKNFIELTVWASGTENAELVKSLHTSEHIQNPILNVELPRKGYYSENESSTWCSGSYQLSYYIKNKDILSIGERDNYLSNVLSEIKRFWDDTEIHIMIKMDKKEIEKKFSDIAIKSCNDKITFSIVEGQVYLDYSNP